MLTFTALLSLIAQNRAFVFYLPYVGEYGTHISLHIVDWLVEHDNIRVVLSNGDTSYRLSDLELAEGMREITTYYVTQWGRKTAYDSLALVLSDIADYAKRNELQLNSKRHDNEIVVHFSNGEIVHIAEVIQFTQSVL